MAYTAQKLRIPKKPFTSSLKGYANTLSRGIAEYTQYTPPVYRVYGLGLMLGLGHTG